MRNPLKKRKEGSMTHPEHFTEEEITALTPTSDFTPEDIKVFRNLIYYKSPNNSADLPKTLLILTQRYATLHCKIRFECNHKGDIAACFSCLTEQILVPDMIERAGKKVVMWPAKR